MSDFDYTDRRKTFRHEMHFPVVKRAAGSNDPEACQMENMSDGGLAFYSTQEFEQNEVIQVGFPILGPDSEFEAEVVHVRKATDGSGRTLIGTKYCDAHATKYARMVEKLCHIESYRQMQERIQDTSISAEDAAREWIHRYGDQFPE